MAVTHHKCPKQFRKYPKKVRGTLLSPHGRIHGPNSVSAERDAHISRTFNLWSNGCRFSTRYHTPPVVLSVPDMMTRFNTDATRAWGKLSWSQTELVRLARRTLFELRWAALMRRRRS